jgi:hypothetical protein
MYKGKGYVIPRGSVQMDNIVCNGGNLKSQEGENPYHSQIRGYSHLVDLRDCYPFVKWGGGTCQLLSELDSMIPSKFNRYFEEGLIRRLGRKTLVEVEVSVISDMYSE